MAHIESLLSARLFLAPQRVGDDLYFVSNLSGRLILYRMNVNGSVPEPLLPPHIALQNPELVVTTLYYVFPDLGQILILLDHDGDENYIPNFIPIEGGYPEPIFGNAFDNDRVSCTLVEPDAHTVYLVAQSRTAPIFETFVGDLSTRTLTKITEDGWGSFASGVTEDQKRVILVQGYTTGDTILSAWDHQNLSLITGTPIEQRSEDQAVPLTSFGATFFVDDEKGIIVYTSLFDDHYGLGYIDLTKPAEVLPVAIEGTVHQGIGELIGFDRPTRATPDRYTLTYNIDGCSWVYEARYDEATRTMHAERVLVGQGPISSGVLEGLTYDKQTDSYALAFSTATSPTQLYLIEGADRATVRQVTNERVLGIPQNHLSPGEDASFTSWDGLRISARLYLPAETLGFSGPRPLVYYVHGGPQGQERPNFAWFSMPLIQFLTLNGLAVFVPNVRGSTGYGLSYTKHVDHDWGGKDRLDHVHALECLSADPRVDTKRAAVVGRSYGGYMTLTLAARHPDLWLAACDMFGPSNLLTFMERIPETWKAYFKVAVGDPVKDRDFLTERSPVTYLDSIQCPMLVIQGRNDPRVVPQESIDVVDHLRSNGREVEMILFENEGHDVLKFENRVTCYNAITDFFRQYLKP